MRRPTVDPNIADFHPGRLAVKVSVRSEAPSTSPFLDPVPVLHRGTLLSTASSEPASSFPAGMCHPLAGPTLSRCATAPPRITTGLRFSSCQQHQSALGPLECCASVTQRRPSLVQLTVLHFRPLRPALGIALLRRETPLAFELGVQVPAPFIKPSLG
jgi:hypothetical protein